MGTASLSPNSLRAFSEYCIVQGEVLAVTSSSRLLKNSVFQQPAKRYLFQIDPIIWTLGPTGSWLEIRIHTDKEDEYIAYVDYYEDYYELERIFVGIIESF